MTDLSLAGVLIIVHKIHTNIHLLQRRSSGSGLACCTQFMHAQWGISWDQTLFDSSFCAHMLMSSDNAVQIWPYSLSYEQDLNLQFLATVDAGKSFCTWYLAENVVSGYNIFHRYDPLKACPTDFDFNGVADQECSWTILQQVVSGGTRFARRYSELRESALSKSSSLWGIYRTFLSALLDFDPKNEARLACFMSARVLLFKTKYLWLGARHCSMPLHLAILTPINRLVHPLISASIYAQIQCSASLCWRQLFWGNSSLAASQYYRVLSNLCSKCS